MKRSGHTSTGDLGVVRKSRVGETRKTPLSQKYTAWTQKRCPGGGSCPCDCVAEGVPWAVENGRGRAGLPAAGQDSSFPISRKGTGATWQKEVGSQVKEGPEDSIPGTGARRQDQHAPRLDQEGGGCPVMGLSSGEEGTCPQWQCPSGLGKGDAGPRARKGDAGPGPAGLPLPAGGEAGGSARRESGQETVPSGGLAATEQSHWKVLDMGGPLGR